MEQAMQIKEAAATTGLTVEAIRYFEREGLVASPHRSDNGYRHYAQDHLTRLRFIANCRALEMSHEEIRALLEASASSAANCDSVNAIVRTHITHVRERVATLRRLLKRLQQIEASCAASGTGGGSVDGCEILRALSDPSDTTLKPHRSHL
jgi:DNA-binding transcriptional MerR regulator